MRSYFLAFERRTTAFALAVASAMLVAAACLGMYQILSRFVFQLRQPGIEVFSHDSMILPGSRVLLFPPGP